MKNSHKENLERFLSPCLILSGSSGEDIPPLLVGGGVHS